MKRLLTVLCLLVVASAGCFSPASRDKGVKVDNADALKNKHLETKCTFRTDGSDGIHIHFSECQSGTLASGDLDAATVEYSGQDDDPNVWNARSHSAMISTTVYFPTPDGNSDAFDTKYTIEGGGSGGFDALIKVPLKSGFGTYQVRFVGENYDNCSWWSSFGGYDSCAAEPMQETRDFVVGKGGFF